MLNAQEFMNAMADLDEAQRKRIFVASVWYVSDVDSVIIELGYSPDELPEPVKIDILQHAVVDHGYEGDSAVSADIRRQVLYALADKPEDHVRRQIEPALRRPV